MIATAADRAERLRSLREDTGLTLDFVGKRIGKSHETVRRYENDSNTKIKPDILAKLAALYKTSVEYIKTGRHAKPKEDAASDVASSNARYISIDDMPFRVLPYLPIRVRATFAESFADDSYKYEKQENLAIPGVPDTKEFEDAIIVEVDGDSMEPTLISGARVLVTPVNEADWQYMPSGIYCVVYRSTFVIKRVKDNELLTTGLLTLHSDNPNGGSYVVRGEDVRAVWRVRWGVFTPIS